MRLYQRAKGGKYSFEEVINGRRYRMTTGVRDKEVAKKIASKKVSLIAENRWLEKSLPAKRITVNELFDALRKHYELTGKASSQNLSLVKRAKAIFGSRMAGELNADDINAHVERSIGEGYAAATTNRIVECLRRAYQLGDIKPPKMVRLKEDNARSGFLTRAEFDVLIAKLPEDLRDFCLFAFLTGMRAGEIRSLAWSDVSETVIRLRGSNAKTKKPRSIVATGELAALLERRQAARAVKSEEGATAVMASTIFHRDGEPVGEFRKSWSSACVAAGLGKMLCPKCQTEGATNTCSKCKIATRYSGRVFHDLRRTAIRNMVRSGVPQSVAMKISGHTTDSTFRRYDICSEEDLAQAMLKVERYHKEEAAKVLSIATK